MFTLELTAEQVQARKGFIVVWESKGRVSRVAFQLKEPKDTADEVVLTSISLEKFGRKIFGSIDREVRIEFTNLGTLTRITPSESPK